MQHVELFCSQCGAKLRLRDKLVAGRAFNCPECSAPLRVDKQAGEPGYKIIAAGPERPNPALRAQASPEAAPVRSARAAYCAAGGLAILLLVPGWLLFKPKGPLRTDVSADAARATQPDDRPADAQQPLAGAQGVPQEERHAPREEARLRLINLGKRAGAPLDETRAFPLGAAAANLPVEQRLGWMATLAALGNPGVRLAIDSSLSWRHPQHDAFVRQRILEFQNPAIPQLVGSDGYPASHFAGVAGIGDDAASLPAHDPRAGIFGYERQTTLDQIHDGASNTLLLLGVAEQLGSWASAGRSTVRGLARLPYVNGPDGFGTGQRDLMLALMADGSVRAISAQADAAVIRGLAAMADGVPAAEPPTAAPHTDDVAVREAADATAPGALNQNPEDPPLEPEFALEAPPKPVDLRAALSLRIARFEQPRRPLADSLLIVADLVGAPIRLREDPEGAWHGRLREPVALVRENSSIEQILLELLAQAQLAFRIQGDHIELFPNDEDP
jgi:hypothetical protein